MISRKNSQPPTLEEEIYEEGVEAAHNGFTLENNPYYLETERAALWDEGFLMGLAEIEIYRRLYNHYK